MAILTVAPHPDGGWSINTSNSSAPTGDTYSRAYLHSEDAVSAAKKMAQSLHDGMGEPVEVRVVNIAFSLPEPEEKRVHRQVGIELKVVQQLGIGGYRVTTHLRVIGEHDSTFEFLKEYPPATFTGREIAITNAMGWAKQLIARVEDDGDVVMFATVETSDGEKLHVPKR